MFQDKTRNDVLHDVAHKIPSGILYYLLNLAVGIATGYELDNLGGGV